MLFAVDFDGTIVSDDHDYADLTTPLEFLPGARDALLALKRAGHTLLLWSARANRAMREDPRLDPLVRAGVRRVNAETWATTVHLHRARYDQMIAFLSSELPGVFNAVDDGMQGKPDADVFIDDRAIRPGYGLGSSTWEKIAGVFGELEPMLGSTAGVNDGRT